MADNNYTARTWFLTIMEKSFDNLNLGVSFDENHCQEIGQVLLSYCMDELHYKVIGTCCVSAKDKFHLHLVVTCPSPIRLTGISKKLGNAHVEPMRGTKEQSLDYIRKLGKFEDKGETVLYEFGTSNGIENNVSNIDQVASDLTISLDQYFFDNHIYDDDSRKKFRNCRESYCKSKFNHCTRDIDVIWITGESGKGKSHHAFEDIIGDRRYFRACVSDKTSFPFNGYDYEEVLWLDELRPDIFKPSELFQILDKYPLNIDVKHGQTVACWTTVIITTAFPLCDYFVEDRNGRNYDNYYKQLIRRIGSYLFPFTFTGDLYPTFCTCPLFDIYKDSYVVDNTIDRLEFDSIIRDLQNVNSDFEQCHNNDNEPSNNDILIPLSNEDINYIQTNLFH